MSLGVSAQSALGTTSELLKTPLCHGLGGLPFEVAKATFSGFVDPLNLCSNPRHGPGSVEAWILVEADNADAWYEHAAEWAECLAWGLTPVPSEEQAGPPPDRQTGACLPM